MNQQQESSLIFDEIQLDNNGMYTGYIEVSKNISANRTEKHMKSNKYGPLSYQKQYIQTKFGKIEHPDGKYIIGQFKNGNQDGLCQISQPNGKIYFGEYKEGIKQGLGRVLFSNVVFMGDFDKGERTGLGVMIELVDLSSSDWMHVTNNNEQGRAGYPN